LTPAERKLLKARAHSLEPVVLIGNKGLTDEVVTEVDRALTVHELIKVRAPSLDRHAREEAFQSLCARTVAEPVQHIGKVFVLYRKKPE
jgi:putative YhbY family RNA-binding protein